MASMPGYFTISRAPIPVAYRMAGHGRRRPPRHAAVVLPDPGQRRTPGAGSRHRALQPRPPAGRRRRSMPAASSCRPAWRRCSTGVTRVAMEYSPHCAIPYVSRVDAGTIELVRGLGVDVVSSGDLIQQFEALLERRGHRDASRGVGGALSHQGPRVRIGRAAPARRRADHRVRHPAADGRLVRGRGPDRRVGAVRLGAGECRQPALPGLGRRAPGHSQERAGAARLVGQARRRPARSTPTSRGSVSSAPTSPSG